MSNYRYCSDCDNTVAFGHDCPAFINLSTIEKGLNMSETKPYIGPYMNPQGYVDPASKYYIDRMWEEYHKIKDELADTKSKLAQAEDLIDVLKVQKKPISSNSGDWCYTCGRPQWVRANGEHGCATIEELHKFVQNVENVDKEELAKIVYAAMQKTLPVASSYPWVDNGNSDMQYVAREFAYKIILMYIQNMYDVH